MKHFVLAAVFMLLAAACSERTLGTSTSTDSASDVGSSDGDTDTNADTYRKDVLSIRVGGSVVRSNHLSMAVPAA